ncbi:hypothetical protein AGLY_003745 [Aphis glycines]|uniref:Uncharacterized protein n=1 Tax=Aphis glycines TaxID=307491 RepID=A0A6G0U1K2_APHGL|nr:hypothetical protein AGLY_003745 [Aphis glycines]
MFHRILQEKQKIFFLSSVDKIKLVDASVALDIIRLFTMANEICPFRSCNISRTTMRMNCSASASTLYNYTITVNGRLLARGGQPDADGGCNLLKFDWSATTADQQSHKYLTFRSNNIYNKKLMRVSVYMFARINQISIVGWSKQQTRYELFRHTSVSNNFKIECSSAGFFLRKHKKIINDEFIPHSTSTQSMKHLDQSRGEQ